MPFSKDDHIAGTNVTIIVETYFGNSNCSLLLCGFWNSVDKPSYYKVVDNLLLEAIKMKKNGDIGGVTPWSKMDCCLSQKYKSSCMLLE